VYQQVLLESHLQYLPHPIPFPAIPSSLGLLGLLTCPWFQGKVIRERKVIRELLVIQAMQAILVILVIQAMQAILVILVILVILAMQVIQGLKPIQASREALLELFRGPLRPATMVVDFHSLLLQQRV
jgi:hypothetical protein